MIYTIYWNDSPIYISDEPLQVPAAKQLTLDFCGRNIVFTDVQQLLAQLSARHFSSAIIYRTNAHEQLRQFKQTMTVIIAGGGLVRNAKGQLLLIHRRGKWDLPKGKLDDGETIEDCAVREVEEETGITGLAIDKPLLVTYHIYHMNGEQILKESHWFSMHTVTDQQPTPQTEEDINEAIWVDSSAIDGYKTDMHLSVQDVLKAAGL